MSIAVYSTENVVNKFIYMKETIIFLFFFSLLSGQILACDCATLPLEKELKEVDYVFHGRVISINHRAYPIAYEFEILKTWKGKKRRKTIITSGMGSGDCGVFFEIGHEYIIYSKRGKTDVCRRTAEIGHTQDKAMLNWKYDKLYRKALKRSKKGPLTDREASYIAGLVLMHQDSLVGKKIAIFDSEFPISKREFFKTWGGHQVDLHYLELEPKDIRNYGVEGMLVAWTKGDIVESEKEFLLAKLSNTTVLKKQEDVISRRED